MVNCLTKEKKIHEWSVVCLPRTMIAEIQNNQAFSIRATSNVKFGTLYPGKIKKRWLNTEYEL
jgi:hypothetical protein